MRLAFSLALLSGVVIGGPSFAATLEAVHGNVSINKGDGFRPVAGSTQVNVGDSVMASKGASARVVYSDGCPVNVTPGSIVTVSKESPCTAFGQAGPNQTPDNNGALIVGGLVVGGIIGGVVYIIGRPDDDEPSQITPKPATP